LGPTAAFPVCVRSSYFFFFPSYLPQLIPYVHPSLFSPKILGAHFVPLPLSSPFDAPMPWGFPPQNFRYDPDFQPEKTLMLDRSPLASSPNGSPLNLLLSFFNCFSHYSDNSFPSLLIPGSYIVPSPKRFVFNYGDPIPRCHSPSRPRSPSLSSTPYVTHFVAVYAPRPTPTPKGETNA